MFLWLLYTNAVNFVEQLFFFEYLCSNYLVMETCQQTSSGQGKREIIWQGDTYLLKDKPQKGKKELIAVEVASGKWYVLFFI